MIRLFQLFLFGFLTGLSYSLTIQTNLGPVKGWESTSRDGRPYLAFTKIPYAQPPIGNLRLKNPEPVKPWTEELDATADSPICLQAAQLLATGPPTIIGEEDCLFVNVYAPKDAKNLPVLAYIHGGAFKVGNPGPREMADYFMDEDVVLVSMTYRLGPLGFMSLEDSNIPGNFGLKDQALALNWIKANIAAFGGNPESITIFGESAGGASTHLHMYSPLSQNLLKGVISQSGSVNKIWSLALPGMMKERTIKIAEFLGCPIESASGILECLQKADGVNVTASDVIFLFWGMDDALPLRPVIEPNVPGAFLVEDPYKKKTTIPWLAGFNSGEALLKTIPLNLMPPSIMEDFVKRVDEITAKQMNLDPDLETSLTIINKIKDQYYPNLTPETAIEQHGKFFADAAFLFPILKSAQKHRGPVYLYHLEYRGEGTLFDMLKIPMSNKEPCHADEIFLLFNVKNKFSLKGTPEDVKVSKAMVKMWANFATFQNPTPPGSEVIWPEYDKKVREYLRITGNGLIIGNEGWPEIYKFWDKLFKPTPTPRTDEL